MEGRRGEIDIRKVLWFCFFFGVFFPTKPPHYTCTHLYFNYTYTYTTCIEIGRAVLNFGNPTNRAKSMHIPRFLGSYSYK